MYYPGGRRDGFLRPASASAGGAALLDDTTRGAHAHNPASVATAAKTSRASTTRPAYTTGNHAAPSAGSALEKKKTCQFCIIDLNPLKPYRHDKKKCLYEANVLPLFCFRERRAEGGGQGSEEKQKKKVFFSGRVG